LARNQNSAAHTGGFGAQALAGVRGRLQRRQPELTAPGVRLSAIPRRSPFC
jgi:hypothetical protein